MRSGRLALLCAVLCCARMALAAGVDAGWRAWPGTPPIAVVATAGATPQLAARPDPTSARFAPDPRQVALGRKLFEDPRLSQPAGTSCASCHDPRRAFGPTLGAALAGPGTPRGSRPGHFSRRAAPSLLYVRYVPRRFFYQDDDAPSPAPYGGLFADGRADTLHEQVRGPLFDPDEMNNASPAALLHRLRATELGGDIARTAGASSMRDPGQMVDAIGRAIEAYLQSDAMAPFASRFDAWQRGHAVLDAQELRGLALFKDPGKGNCIACHTMNDSARRPERSLFTDFGYEALGVPRNAKLARPGRFDTGLDASARRLGWSASPQWCGYFRTPTLRNVALRERFMHNAGIRSLRDAVRFYATRSTDPHSWYGKSGSFDDVPTRCRANINVATLPLNRRAGAKPALTDSEIDDLVAFLRTLTDAPAD